MTPIEVAAFITGVAAVWLAARQNIWNWPFGIVNVSLYALLFWRERLYADAGLQVVYLALSLYGWWAWLYGGAQRTALHVRRVPMKLFALTVLAGIAFAGGVGLALRRYTDAAVPLLDSALTGGSLVAQFLMTRKYVESWPIWVLLDVMYVGLFISRELYLTALLYGVFTALALYAWWEWQRSLRTEQAAEAVAA